MTKNFANTATMLLFALAASIATAQTTQTIRTIGGGYLGDGGLATQAGLYEIRRLAVAADGTYYIADKTNQRIRRVSPDGRITTYAGTGDTGFSGDNGPAINAKFNFPEAVALDAEGNLYVADVLNSRVRRIGLDGRISTYVENAGYPKSLHFDKNGVLYVCDRDNNRVYRVNPQTRAITLVAGTGAESSNGDGGDATRATLAKPASLAFDPDGSIYIAELLGHRIRKISTSGTISTIAGNGREGYAGDGGPAAGAQFKQPDGIWMVGSDLYIADSLNHRIRRIRGGIITTVIGTGVQGFDGEGAAPLQAQLNSPRGGAVDARGNIYVCDLGNARIRRIDSTGTIKTIAGAGSSVNNGDGGPALGAYFRAPAGLYLEPNGTMLVADPGGNRIRAIDRSGIVSTWAGGEEGILAGDGGPLSAARFFNPVRITSDGKGTYYIVDKENHRIRRVDSNGRVSTFAGTTKGNSGDEQRATSAQLNTPYGITIHPITGEVYFTEFENHCVRRVDSAGIMHLVAGVCGRSGFLDGEARNSLLNKPSDIKIDPQGIIYIADSGNARVRKIENGQISAYAGDGRDVYEVTVNRQNLGYGGPAVQGAIGAPNAMAFDKDFNLFIATTANVVRVDRASRIITAVAGDGFYRYTGDGGPALQASVFNPFGLAIDADGNIIIADTQNGRIRIVSSSSATTTVTFNTDPPGQRVIVDGQEVPHGQVLRWIPGSSHQIAAKPVSGTGDTRYVFNRWSSGADATQQVRAGAGSSIFTAFFDTQHRLTVSVNGAGSVSFDPPSPDGGYYNAGTAVQVTPVASSGWTFAGFSGDIAGGDSASVTMDGPRKAVADFAAPTPELSVTPANMTFRFQEAGPAPSDQIVAIASTGSALPYTIQSSGSALTFTASQTSTPGIARVSVRTSGLAAGTYNETLTITSPGAAAVAIPVTIEVTPAPVKPDLKVTPTVLNITASTSAQNLVQYIDATSSGTPLRIGWGVKTGAQWLLVRTDNGNTTTPARLRVDIAPTGLPAGNHSGRIEVTSGDSQNGVQVIVVNLTVEPEAPRQIFSSVQRVNFQYRQKRQSAGVPAAPQQIDVTADQATARFFPRAVVSSPIPWLTVRTADGSASSPAPGSITLNASGEGLAPGTYEGAVEFRLSVNGDVITRVPVQFDVLPPAPLELTSDRPEVRFDVPAGSPGQAVVWSIQNNSEEPVSLSVSSTGDAPWLKVVGERTDASPDKPGLIRVGADASGLGAGTYAGTVVANAGDVQLTLPVVMTVNQSARRIFAAEKAVKIVGKAGFQRYRYLDLLVDGQGTANWTSTATTLSGAPGWLSLSPASGSISGNQSQRVKINTSGLSAGTYTGTIRINSSQTDNTEEISVTLELSPDKDAPPEVDRAGVILIAGPGVSQTNRIPVELTYGKMPNRDVSLSIQPASWLRTSATTVRLSNGAGAGSFELWAQPSGITAGQYRGTVIATFPDGQQQSTSVLLIVTSAANKLPSADGCQPSKFSSVFANPQGLNVRVGEAAMTEFAIVDNCGGLLTNGAVSNSFTTGDRPVDLRPISEGIWRASWVPRLGEDSSIGVNLNVLGSEGVLEVESTPVVTYLTGRSDAPIIDRRTPFVTPGLRDRSLAVAPGGRVIIRGEKLSDSRIQSSSPVSQLGNTRVTMGGLPVEILSVSPNEIEVIVPEGLRSNVGQPLIVARGTEISAPEAVSVATSWPTIVQAGAGKTGDLDLILTNVRPADVSKTIIRVNGSSCALSQLVPVKNEPGFYYGRAMGCGATEGAKVEMQTAGSRTGAVPAQAQAGRGSKPRTSLK
jgi:sugar lactone lactonase YvrE